MKSKEQNVKAWCVVGDFNSIRRTCERKGVNPTRDYRREISAFNWFIEKTELENILIVGRKFTWYKINK